MSMKFTKALHLLMCGIFVIFTLVVTPAGSSAVSDNGPPNTSDWTLVFEDNFNGTSLDSDNWSAGFGWGMTAGYSQGTVSTNNISVSNGVLHLDVTKINGEYYYGVVNTKNKVTFAPGVYLEARIKGMDLPGCNQAFWSKSNTEEWPPEIDFVEMPQHDSSSIYKTMHHIHYCSSEILGDSSTHRDWSNGNTSGPNYRDNYHTFGCLWLSDRIIHYVDGVMVRKLDSSGNWMYGCYDQTVLDSMDSGDPFYMMISQALGLSWIRSDLPSDISPYDCRVDVDWVKIWEYDHDANTSSDLARDKNAYASSTDNANRGPEKAVDGLITTRFASGHTDNEWIYVDLSQNYIIDTVKLYWERAYGSSYKMQVSNDAANWTDIYSTTSGDGGIDEIGFSPTSARYVRMLGIQRATSWGYSLWDFEVYEAPESTPTPTVTPTSTLTPTPMPTPSPTPAPETINDTDTSITYIGSGWGYNDKTGPYQGDYHSSNTTNDYYDFIFDGTYARVYGTKNAYTGKADVYVDGQFQETIDLYSSTQEFQTLYYDTGTLTNGTHTVKLTVKGEKNQSSNNYWVECDKLQIQGIALTPTVTPTPTPTPTPTVTPTPSPTPTWTFIDDRDDSVVYDGSWSEMGDASDYNSTMSQNGTQGRYAQYTFNGTGVKLAVRKGAYGGIVDVYLDDNLVLNDYDTYNSTKVYQVVIYENTSLTYGSHTIKLCPTGNKNASSAATLAMFDYISVQ